MGCGVSKATAAVKHIRDERASAPPGLEATAVGRAISVFPAQAGNVLGPWCGRARTSGRLARPWRSCPESPSLARAELLRGDVVGLGVAEAAAAVALLRDDGAGALAALEATALGSTVGVRLARAGDELGAGGDAGHVGRSGD